MPESRRRKRRNRRAAGPPPSIDLSPAASAWRQLPSATRQPPGPYDHLPSFDQLKRPTDRPARTTDRAQVKNAWELATRRADEAHEDLQPAVKRLRTKLRWSLRGTVYELSRSPAPDHRDTYLVVRETDAPDGKYRGLRQHSEITPGCVWLVVDRRRGHKSIELTVDADGVAQLRSHDTRLTATPEHWTQVATERLAQGSRAKKLARLPVGVLRFLFSYDFLFLALIVSVVVAVVLAIRGT